MRKAYIVKVPLTAPNTSEPPNAKNAKKGDCDCGSHEIEVGEEDNLPETLQVGDADDLIGGPTFADVSTFTNIRSSVQTDTLINNKDSSLESTGKKDLQVEQVLLSSPCTVRKRPAPEDTSKSNSDCQIAGASKPASIPSIKGKRQNIDDKENNDPNTDCQITGSEKSYLPCPKRRRQNLDSEDLNLITNGKC